VFDHDCQRFDLDELSATDLNVAFSAPLSVDDVDKLCTTSGTFHRRADGSVLVDYGNFLGYHEDWYVLHKSAHVLVADLCFAAGDDARDYGTLVLSRVPLDQLPAAERDALDSALSARLGFGLDDTTAVRTTDCANE